MVYRYSWIAGIAAIALAFWELSFLLRDSETGTPWQVAILVSVLLGAGITWTAIAYRAHAAIVVGVNIVAFVLTVGLLVAPDTLLVIIPTRGTWDAVWFQLDRAFEVIRYGVEPVRSLPGLVMLIGSLFWTLGFLLVAGLLNSRPFVAILTPLIVALQFVIIDRRPKGVLHLVVFVTVVAMCLLAIRFDERDSGSGRLQRVNATKPPSKRPSTAIVVLVAATVFASVGAVAIAGDQVPRDGLASWRTPAGFSDGYSSATYNPFTDIKAQVISQTNQPLFVAQIEGEVDPGTVRFRTVTLDVFQNGKWGTDRVRIFPLDEEPWIEPQQVYRGETRQAKATITIQDLNSTWLPAPLTPITAGGEDERAMRVRRVDGSLIMPGDITYSGMQYAVIADIPRYDGPTIAALALARDEPLDAEQDQAPTLSPTFQLAVDEGEALPDVLGPLPEPLILEDEEHWLELPDDELGEQFVAIAEQAVGNVETNFEKALVLENWFRDSGEFRYETEVPGQHTTSDVIEWLTDGDGNLTDADGYSWAKHGYCEQFATAMALMARAVGVPSRVVLGFTPGEKLNDTFVQVYDRNAHSWVELWIPSYGWMEFDPTPRGPGYSARTANEVLAETLDFSPAAYAALIPDPTFIDLGDEEIPGSGPLNPDRGEIDRTVILGGGEAGGGGFDLPPWAPFAFAVLVGVLIVAVAAPLVEWVRRRRRVRRLAAGDVSAAWEDIVDRLTDLREPIDAANTPLEAARSMDDAFVPLAEVYGESVYGDGARITALLERASDAHLRAEQHLTTRYSRMERIRATYRPSRLIRRWHRIRARLSLKR